MHPRVSINALSSFKWPLADDLALMAALGVRHYGFPMLKIEQDVEGGIAALRASGLDISCVAASTAGASLLEPDLALAALKPAIDTAAALSSPLCYFTAGKSPERATTDQAALALAAALQPAKAYAEGLGVALAIENNSVTTRHHGFVHTLRDAIQLAEEAESRSVWNCRIAGSNAAWPDYSTPMPTYLASCRSATIASGKSCGSIAAFRAMAQCRSSG